MKNHCKKATCFYCFLFQVTGGFGSGAFTLSRRSFFFFFFFVRLSTMLASGGAAVVALDAPRVLRRERRFTAPSKPPLLLLLREMNSMKSELQCLCYFFFKLLFSWRIGAFVLWGWMRATAACATSTWAVAHSFTWGQCTGSGRSWRRKCKDILTLCS